MNKEQYRERIAAGLCVWCGIRSPVEGRRMCSVCLPRYNERRHAMYMEKASAGLCVFCRQPTDGYALCPACRQKQHERYVEKRKAMGARLFVL